MASASRVRTLVVAGLALLLGVTVADLAMAQGVGVGAATVEVRVWQNVDDERDLYVSARPAGGSWRALGTVPLALDGLTANGAYRYGDIALALPLAGGGMEEVEVRIWQEATLISGIFVGVRFAGGSWSVPGTAALPLDDGLAASGRYRYGGVTLAIPPRDAAWREPAWPDASRSDIALPSVAIEFEGDFQGTERAWTQELERHFNSTVAFFAQRYGLTAQGLTIIMKRPEKGDRAMYGDNTILMPTNLMNGSVMVHEYVHALQDQLSAGNFIPAWIVEGMASYFDQNFPRLIEERIPSSLYDARHSQDSLHSMEITFPNYPVSSLAIHQLVLTSGEKALFNFFSSLKNNTSWQESFREAFGITVDEFYKKFASYRAEVAPSFPEIRGFVLAPDSNLVPHFEVYASRSAPRSWISHNSLSVTDLSGRFTIPIRSGEYVLGVRHPDCGEAGFLDDDGSLTRSREKARIFEIGDSNVLGVVVNLPADPTQPCAYPGSGWWEWWRPFVDVEEPERMSGVRVAFFAGLLPGAFKGIPGLTDGPAESARFNRPMGMALTASGDVIVADFWNHAIRRIAPDGMVTTVAGGNGQGVRDGPAATAQFTAPSDVAVHADGSIYVADSRSGRIHRIGTDGTVATVAGGGPIVWGDFVRWKDDVFRDGPATEARFDEPFAITFDHKGNLLIVDRGNRRIRALSPAGRVSTLAGPARIANDNGASGIAIDDDGTIFFAGGFVGMFDGHGNVSTVLQSIQGGPSGGIAIGPDGLYVVALPQYTSDTSDDYQLFRIARDGSTLSAIHITGAHRLAGIVRADDGTLFVSDTGNNTIWKITFDGE